MTQAALRLAAVSLCVLAGAAALAAAPSPYSGQETREIKALSRAEIDDLLAGRGMGLAKAGELNGYPGPAHVLEMAGDLALTSQQLADIGAIKERMSAAALALGGEIVERERDLDRRFAAGTIGEAELRDATEAIGSLQGRLRAVHLAAHLATRALLSEAQIARYAALRGYGSDPGEHAHPHRHGD